MACATEHSGFNFVLVSLASAIAEASQGRPVFATSLAMGLASACFPSLPDVLEPALHPNHRKFFHSLAFAGLLGYGVYHLYGWQPEDAWHQLVRAAGLVLGAAYLAHLARDAFTAKSLPLA